MRRTIVGLFLLAGATPAFAGKDDPFGDDDDEPVFEDEGQPEEEEPAPPPKPAEPTPPPAKKTTTPPPAPAPEEEAEEEEIEFEDEEPAPGEAIELEDEAGKAKPQEPGADTTPIYRRQLAAVEGMPPDEEVMAWEAYLQQYPNSLFRSQIEQRTDELLSSQYRGRPRTEQATIDARKQQLYFVQPLRMPNLNPRSRVNLNLQIGFGAQTLFTGGQADFEWAFLRNVSVHGGFDGTFNGWGIDAGARYAFVKSTKHQLVATIMADARVNLSGTPFFQARPTIGLGKIFGPVQLLVSFGADIGTRTPKGVDAFGDVSRTVEPVALLGGLHLAARLAPPVALFVESDFYLRDVGRKDLQGDPGVYAFQTLSFGLRFYPRIKTRPDPDPLELAAAGQVGVVSNYLQPYLGAVSLQGTYYLKERER
jgi:hypothetical protein